MTTWFDIKLATLQKMFAADGSTIVKDESHEGLYSRNALRR